MIALKDDKTESTEAASNPITTPSKPRQTWKKDAHIVTDKNLKILPSNFAAFKKELACDRDMLVSKVKKMAEE